MCVTDRDGRRTLCAETVTSKRPVPSTGTRRPGAAQVQGRQSRGASARPPIPQLSSVVQPRLDLAALEEAARERLDPGAYAFVAGGAGDERTLAANLEGWSRLALRPRILCDVAAVSTETTVLGTTVAAPVLVAPMGIQRVLDDDGEPATRRGAADAGSLTIVSTRSSVPVVDVAAASEGPWWFQVYILRDRGRTEELVSRAAEGGCGALVVTGDTPVVAYKPRLSRHRLEVPDDWYLPGLVRPDGGPSADAPGAEQDPSFTFADVEWLAELADIPLVVKGVLRADDARASVAAGAAGIVVSNHGGRQLDGAVATAEALPEVVDAVGDEAEVYVDGGIRRGTDVLRALALGAQATLVGRPAAWGLATGGADGVRAVLDGLRLELAEALALVGVASATSVPLDILRT